MGGVRDCLGWASGLAGIGCIAAAVMVHEDAAASVLLGSICLLVLGIVLRLDWSIEQRKDEG